jgi:hypothetical protein
MTGDRLFHLWAGPRRFGWVTFRVPDRILIRSRNIEDVRDYYMGRISEFLWDVHRGQSLAQHSRGQKRWR